MKLILLVILYLFFSFFLFGQTNDTIGINYELDEVIVTAQIKKQKKANTLQRIRLIVSDKIESGMFTNLSELLQQENNIQISEDNILGSSVKIQGISGQNVKILIDDMPVIGRLNGNIDLSQINLANVKQVEIVEGPLSVNYGTNALAGTINIITKKRHDNTINLSLNSFYETVGRYNSDLFFAYKLKQNTFSFEGGRHYFSGWSEHDKFKLFPVKEPADTNRFKSWKPKEKTFGKLQHLYSTSSCNARTYLSYFYEKITNRGFPRAPYYETAFDDYYYTHRRDVGSDISFLMENKKIHFLLGYNHYTRIKNTLYKDLTTLNETFVKNNSSQDTSHFSMLIGKCSFSSTEREDISYQFGFDVESEFAEGQRIISDQQRKSDYAFFSNVEWEIKKRLMIRPGIRFIYNTKYNAPVTPAFHALYKPNDNITIRASYARGFRAPTLKELFFEFVDVNHNIIGNSDLTAENSSNYQLSAEIVSPRINNISLDISSFYNSINNKIELKNSYSSKNEYSYFNIAGYENLGASLDIKFSKNNITANLGTSFIGIYNNLYEENREFNYGNEYSTNLIYFSKKQEIKFSIVYKYIGEQILFGTYEDGSINQLNSDSYHLLNMSISKDLFNSKLLITVGGKNLFNVTNIRISNGAATAHSSSNSILPIEYGSSFVLNLKYRL